MTNTLSSLIATGLLCPVLAFAAPPNADQNTRQYWVQQGSSALQEALRLTPNTRTARNIILFIGDGNGVTSVTATRIFDGQTKGMSGEENLLSYEQFPFAALSKTYNTDQQTPDSAGTMTAIITGAKSRAGVISVGPEVVRSDCHGGSVIVLPTLLEQARARGKAVGVVTTTRITHATPAATYAHSVERDWEGDTDIPATMKKCAKDIASQLIDNGTIDVAMGGGRQYFLPVGEADPEYPAMSGTRQDGRNLVAEWAAANPGGQYIWNSEQFNSLDPKFTGNILALFEPSHMHYEADRVAEEANEPSLAEMTAKAIDRLDQKDTGYFLMVEGGRIDHAHHAGNAYRALRDGQAFARAVQVAVEKTNPDETLIVVTADHSHTLTMAGYPTRGNPILGKVIGNDEHGNPRQTPQLAADGQPYTTLGYMNGPGYGHPDSVAQRYAQPPNPGRHLSPEDDTTGKNFHQESLVPAPSETHGGEDVAIYATGPWAHLFHGVHEQNYIYHVMQHAFGFKNQQSE